MRKKKTDLSTRVINWIGTTQSVVFHTVVFITFFLLGLFGISFEIILLILTTLVSLEAIYLGIFIQMSVNRQNQRLVDVEKDVEHILEDTEELTEEENA